MMDLIKFRLIKFDTFRSSSYLRVTTAACYVVSPKTLLRHKIMSEQCYMDTASKPSLSVFFLLH